LLGELSYVSLNTKLISVSHATSLVAEILNIRGRSVLSRAVSCCACWLGTHAGMALHVLSV